MSPNLIEVIKKYPAPGFQPLPKHLLFLANQFGNNKIGGVCVRGDERGMRVGGFNLFARWVNTIVRPSGQPHLRVLRFLEPFPPLAKVVKKIRTYQVGVRRPVLDRIFNSFD